MGGSRIRVVYACLFLHQKYLYFEDRNLLHKSLFKLGTTLYCSVLKIPMSFSKIHFSYGIFTIILLWEKKLVHVCFLLELLKRKKLSLFLIHFSINLEGSH